jgi:hypothetical protein
MQVPSIPCRKAVKGEELDFVTRGSVVAGVCTSALVQALAIAKTIDRCGLRVRLRRKNVRFAKVR